MVLSVIRCNPLILDLCLFGGGSKERQIHRRSFHHARTGDKSARGEGSSSWQKRTNISAHFNVFWRIVPFVKR